ncbi:MAG: DUF2760 domain-containing protein [Zavarzinella sp.]
MEYVIGIIIGLLVGAGVGVFLGMKMAIARFGSPATVQQLTKLAEKMKLDASITEKVDKIINPPPPKPSGEAIRILSILQREARLLDFLMEDVAAFSDEQIGASVRDIHGKSQTQLKKILTLDPVLSLKEGESVTVKEGFDPSTISVIGNVSGKPPFTGILQHSGWRVKAMAIPALPDSADPMVLMPAEVEVV